MLWCGVLLYNNSVLSTYSDDGIVVVLILETFELFKSNFVMNCYKPKKRRSQEWRSTSRGKSKKQKRAQKEREEEIKKTQSVYRLQRGKFGKSI
jgi:hypothetical protein